MSSGVASSSRIQTSGNHTLLEDSSRPLHTSEVATEIDSDLEEVTQEFLDSLLEKARINIAGRAQGQITQESHNIDFEKEIIIESEPKDATLPSLDPGKLPRTYINFEANAKMSIYDPDVERISQASSSLVIPAPPITVPKLTKKEKMALRNKTTGLGWFDLPSPDPADLPRLHREVEALRLHNSLDPKRFYKKDEGEGKGLKGLPKHFAIGTVVLSSSPFGGPSSENLARAERKRTLVDELVDDSEARSYAKRKFEDLQKVRGAKGRGTLAKKKALRKQKW